MKALKHRDLSTFFLEPTKGLMLIYIWKIYVHIISTCLQVLKQAYSTGIDPKQQKKQKHAAKFKRKSNINAQRHDATTVRPPAHVMSYFFRENRARLYRQTWLEEKCCLSAGIILIQYDSEKCRSTETTLLDGTLPDLQRQMPQKRKLYSWWIKSILSLTLQMFLSWNSHTFSPSRKTCLPTSGSPETPWKINVEPKKSPMYKGKSSEPNLHGLMFQPLIFMAFFPHIPIAAKAAAGRDRFRHSSIQEDILWTTTSRNLHIETNVDPNNDFSK